MNRSVVEQEREIRDMLRRAKNSPDRHGSLRQETFRRLIDLAHSQHVSLKILAAGNVCFFLTDFPDLEEAAIDAIYDLCEDSSSKVRVEGYLAITQVSKTQGKWIKRNADVLVQLLQSEEADEVVVVKRALTEHLDMDPKTTLGVLCDQILPQNDTTDEEEISIRERLRSLVLAFLAGEAKRAICERFAVPGESGEPVLYEGLFAAIPHLGMNDLQLIIKDLTYDLPAFKSRQPNERGSELLQLLLAEKAAPALKAELHAGSKTLGITLTATRPILEICEDIACTLQVAPAVDLLQFYCTSLIGKITLQKFQAAEQQWIVRNMARVLEVAEKQERNPRFLSLRRTIVDACPYLLEVFKNSTIPETELATTFGVLVQACNERTKESSWTVPPHLSGLLQEFRKRPEIAQNKQLENIIRSLTSPNQTTTQSTLQFNKATSVSRTQIPSTLPSRAPGLRHAGFSPSLVHSQAVSAAQDGTMIKRDNSDTSARPTKRTKVEEVTNTPRAPSLLSRLGSSISRQSSRSDLSSRTQSAPSMSEDELPSQPSQGLSIKGAAAKQAKQNSSSNTGVNPSSLLERLQDSYTRDPGARQHQRDGGRKRRNI